MRAGGTLTLNNTTLSGTYSVTGGAAGTGATAGQAQGQTLYLQGGTAATVLTGTQTLAGDDAVAGAGGLTQSGTGTLTVSGNNANYTGATTVTGGLINFNAANNFGSGNITLNGGGLQWATGTTTDISSRLAALGAGGGTFDTNGNNVALASSLSGSGGLTKAGTGTLTLSVANSYLGGTTVNAGTLQISGAGTLGNIGGATTINGGALDLGGTTQTQNGGLTLTGGTLQNGTLSSSGTFDMQAGSVSAALAGTGGVSKTTAGTATFSGANTYTGNTSITNGTLALTGAGTLGAITNAVTVNGATAILNLGGTTQTQNGGVSLQAGGTLQNGTLSSTATFDMQSGTVSAVLAGTGGMSKTTAGTATFSGTNIYTGNTSIAAGTLALTGAGTLGAITNAVTVNGATAILDLGGTTQTQNGGVSLQAGGTIQNGTLSSTATFDMQSGTVSAALAGSGALIKSGTSTVTLSGVNTYTGPTTVNAGTLSVNGSIVSSSGLTVNAGGSIGGNGTLGNTTINGGTLAPGNSIGTLTIQGNLVLTSAAAYIVEVSPTQADRTNVTGTATLAGTVQAVFGPGSYIARTYTILSAAGGRSGTFGSLTTSGLPAGFAAALSYTGTDAILNLTAVLGQQPTTPGQQPLPNGALSGNQLNVANSLNSFFNNGGTLPPGFVTIFGLTGANLGNALSQLSGEAGTGAQQAGFQMGSQFLNLMLDPFVDGRSGVAGTSGPALGFAPERDAALPSDIALAYSSVLKAPAMQAQTYEPRWSAWGGAYGGSNKTSGDPAVLGSHDLAARTAGFAGGLDYRLSPNSVVGLALAGGGTNWSLANGLGGGKSDAFQAGIYGATKYGPAYLAAAFAFTNHWMSTDRFAFAGDHLTASFNAQSYGGRVESGYRFATMFGGLTPYAAIQAQSFRTPGYSETDANGGGFALAYNSRTGTDTRSELGTRFDHVLALYTNAVLSLRARLAWAHDWVSDPTLAPVFQALPGASFIVNGATPAKNSALASAGTELRLANGIALLAKFDGEFASHSSTYAGTGTIRYTW